MENSLWPSFDNIPEIRTPKSILLEQAGYLEKASQNFLKASVTSYPGTLHKQNGEKEDTLNYQFKITAPLLGDYSVVILNVQHTIFMYPLSLRFSLIQKHYNVQNEEQFVNALRDIFNDEKTKTLITNLLSQSKAAKMREV